MGWISKKNLNALHEAVNKAEREAADARIEAKGYYDEANELNEFFRSVQNTLRKTELPPVDVLSREDIKRAYEQSSAVMGVVNYISDNVGEVMGYLELTDRNGDPVEKHPILDLLRRPNDRFTLKKFGQAWSINKLLFGDAFVYAPPMAGKERIPTEMYIIPSHKVAIKEGRLQPMTGIQILNALGSTRKGSIDIKDIFESFDYNLDPDSFFGTSKVVAAALYLSIMDKGMRRQDKAIENGGVANIITPAKDNMGVMPKDADQVMKKFNDRSNVGKTMALRVPVDVHELGNKPVDLDILASHKEAVTALCFVYHLPVDLYYGQAKYENAKEAKKAIYEQNAIPLANEFAEDFLHFLKMDKEGYRLKVNVDNIDVLKKDSGETLDNLTKMNASLNEKREAFGYERLDEDWADLPMIPMGVQFGAESYDITEE